MQYLQMAKSIEEDKAPMHSGLPHLFWQSQEPNPWHGQHNAHDYPQVHHCLCQKQKYNTNSPILDPTPFGSVILSRVCRKECWQWQCKSQKVSMISIAFLFCNPIGLINSTRLIIFMYLTQSKQNLGSFTISSNTCSKESFAHLEQIKTKISFKAYSSSLVGF